MASIQSLEATRLAYAQQICLTAKTTSQALLTAFATVPREHFLGPGPWSILTARTACDGSDYSRSPSADPVHLDTMAVGGRMLIPLTAQLETGPDAELGSGKLLKITRLLKDNVFAAQFISTVGIYHCAGARNPQHNEAIRVGLSRSNAEAVRSLRRDVQTLEQSCWYHSDTFCLSMLDA